VDTFYSRLVEQELKDLGLQMALQEYELKQSLIKRGVFNESING
jgi:hypothetical protein